MRARPGNFFLAFLMTGSLILAEGNGEKEIGKKPNKETGKTEQQPGEKNVTGPNRPQDYKKLRIGADGMPLPADHTKVDSTKAALDTARTNLNKAIANSYTPSSASTENELWKQEDYRQACFELRRVQADFDRVRQPIFDALRTDSYYRELEVKKQESEKLMRSLILTGRGSFDWLFPQAMVALDLRNRLTREQIMAMAQSPEVEDVRQKMLLSASKVRMIRNKYVADQGGPEAIKAAKSELEKSRTNFKQAMSNYNQALAEEAEYERIRQDYIANVRQNPKVPETKQPNK